MAHFEKIELTGATYEEALANAPFGIQKNATQAWKNFQAKNPGMAITEGVKRQWMEDYLKKETKLVAGSGCYIVTVPAVKSDRKRPYQFEDVKQEGTTEYVKVIDLVDEATGTVIAYTKPVKVARKDKEGNPILNEDGTPKMTWTGNTKADAKELGRTLYTDKGFKGNIVLKKNKRPMGEDVIGRFTYAPSKGSHPCTVMAFGMVND